MSYFELSVDHELKLIRITVIGELFHKEGKEIITTGRTTAAEYGYDVLYDMRQGTTTVNFSEWYFLPRDLKVFQIKKTKDVKAAVLVSPQDKAAEGYKFYENVTTNMGISVRIFLDESEAIEWLRKSSKDVNILKSKPK